jgi:hypothetical protein
MSTNSDNLKQADIKKIESKLDKIQNTIEKKGEYIYFIVDDDDVKLVSKGNDKSETNKKFLEKLHGKSKYIGKDVYEVRISINKRYIREYSEFVAGPLSLKIKQFVINKKYKLEHHAKHNEGAVWYTNKDIINDEFHFSKLKDIIGIMHKENIDILNIAGVRAVDILS